MNSRGLAFSAKLCGRLDTRLKSGDVPGYNVISINLLLLLC